MEFFSAIIILIFSVVVHEVSHGAAAYWLGDPTAKYAGRLTLNPLKHLDPWGSVIIPLFLVIISKISALGGFIFGWAKPVPYNPYNLRDQKYGPALVGLAGPLSNILLALLAAFAMKALLLVTEEIPLLIFLAKVVEINILLVVFNLLPIPPLDGSKLLFSILPISEQTKMMLESYGFTLVLIVIFIFSPLLNTLKFLALIGTSYIVNLDIISFIR